MKMLEVQDLVVNYGQAEVIKGISFKVEARKISAIIGANGSGKTTILKTLMGGIKRRRGKIIGPDGKEIQNLPSHKRVQMGMSLVPEGRGILTKMTVLENIEMGAFARRDRYQMRKDLEGIFQKFPILEDRKYQLGGSLSGGQQQMLALARALIANPRVLLMDEPSLGLAPLIVNEIFRFIKEVNEEGTTILLVEQNARKSLQISLYGFVLETGIIKLKGFSEDLLKNEDVKKAYLGE